jgi:UPF0042 nucleotide-binding protein
MADENKVLRGRITLMSFGFKYGLPNANYYFDVGFLKNPAREKDWGFFAVPDQKMRDYVVNQDMARRFLDHVVPLVAMLAEVDQHQVFAFGCNAGRHRSCIMVTEIQRRLAEMGIESRVKFRDNEDPFHI